MVIQQYAPARRTIQTGTQSKQRGFATTGRPQYGTPASFFYREGYILQDWNLMALCGECFEYVLNLEDLHKKVRGFDAK
jgi:hypothetical protein